MKKSIFSKEIFVYPFTIMLAISIALILTDCSKGKINDLEQIADLEKIADLEEPYLTSQMKEQLECMGFNIENIQIIDDYLVVENDIAIQKKELERILENNGLNENIDTLDEKQYSVDPAGVVNWGNVGNIFYTVDPTLGRMPEGLEWVTAFHQAAWRWSNNIPDCNINFIIALGTQQPDLTIYGSQSQAQGLPECARTAALNNLNPIPVSRSSFPGGGEPGTFISVNNENSAGFTLQNKIFIAMHEIGHTLGYRHANAVFFNEADNPAFCGFNPIIGLNLLHGTPILDNNSVMLTAPIIIPPPNFSAFDVRAAQMLYPADCCPPIFQSIKVKNLVGNAKEIDVTLSFPIGWFGVRFELLSGGNVVTTWDKVASTNSFILVTIRSGTHTIRASGFNYGGVNDFIGPPSQEWNVQL